MAERIILIENTCVITDGLKIATLLNNYYYINIASTLCIPKLLSNTFSRSLNPVEVSLIKYKNHPSILQIKSTLGEITRTFGISHVQPEVTYNKMMNLDSKKSNSVDISTANLKTAAKACCTSLTDCINNPINDSVYIN